MRRLGRVLLVAGTAGAVLGLSKAHAVRHDYDYTSSSRFGWSVAYTLLLLVAAYGAGLPDMARSRRAAVLATFASTAVASVGISLVQLLAGSPLLPRFVVLGTPAVLVPLYALCTTLSADGRARQARRDRFVVVAGPQEAADLARELDGASERPAVVVAVIAPEDAARKDPRQQPLVDLVGSSGATAVVLDRQAQGDDSIVAQAGVLHESGVRIRTLSLCYDQWLGKLPVSELERISLLFDIGELHRTRYGRLKRIVDVVAGVAGVLVLGVVLPFVLLGNRLGNRGPLLYRQPRVGKNGRTFTILKLRTMSSEAGSSDWTEEDDPRITPFGARLRRAHLDELPQAINVLRGDLSVVGPRPEQPRYVEELKQKIPFYNLRHLVRPGLTGWAQVKYPYGSSEGDALEKLQYEFYYLRHQGLALHFRILARTLRAVVGMGGR